MLEEITMNPNSPDSNINNPKQEPLPHYSTTHRYGVMLLNIGGPQSEAEIHDYLYRLFSDPFIVPLPGFFRRRFARIATRLRQKKTAARYAAIGGKSPLNDETAVQAKKLEEVLQFPVVFAMRYTEPFVYSAQRDLEDRHVNRLIVLPLYPQYCNATTMSALEDFLEHRGNEITYRFIEQHFNFAGYTDTMSHLLSETLRKLDDNLVTRVLFVAHSIPMRLVRDGDPYVEQIKSTVAAITQQKSIPYSYSLAFQSSLGPIKWQGPTLNQVLQQFRQEQVEQVVVHPLSFVAENLETLYDLDIQFKELCLNAGIKKYFRVPAPSSHPMYINALATLVKEEIDNWEVHHVQ